MSIGLTAPPDVRDDGPTRPAQAPDRPLPPTGLRWAAEARWENEGGSLARPSSEVAA